MLSAEGRNYLPYGCESSTSSSVSCDRPDAPSPPSDSAAPSRSHLRHLSAGVRSAFTNAQPLWRVPCSCYGVNYSDVTFELSHVPVTSEEEARWLPLLLLLLALFAVHWVKSPKKTAWKLIGQPQSKWTNQIPSLQVEP